MVSFLWDIGKQHSSRRDAAERGVPSGAILFAQRNSSKDEIKKNITPNTPKNESGLIRLIMMGESIVKYGLNEQKGVNLFISLHYL